MTAYQPLLALQAEHGFYDGGVCRGLAFQPSPATVQLMQRAGCVWRATEGGFVIHAERDRIGHFVGAGVGAHGDRNGDGSGNTTDGREPFTLGFVALSRDGAFHAVTEGLALAADSGWLFAPLVAGAPDTLQLDAGMAVCEPVRSPRWSALLPERALGQRPAFGVLLTLPDARLRQCHLRFAARAVPWKYYLVGDWDREGLYLADADQGMAFSALAPERLPNGREVLSARSDGPIALAERARQQIQLRRRVNGSDRVVVKRLPVAAPGTWGLRPDGAGLVAEIYVNR